MSAYQARLYRDQKNILIKAVWYQYKYSCLMTFKIYLIFMYLKHMFYLFRLILLRIIIILVFR